jgi:hypothetical protein
MANVNAIGWSEVLAHVYACGVRGDEGEGDRFIAVSASEPR